MVYQRCSRKADPLIAVYQENHYYSWCERVPIYIDGTGVPKILKSERVEANFVQWVGIWKDRLTLLPLLFAKSLVCHNFGDNLVSFVEISIFDLLLSPLYFTSCLGVMWENLLQVPENGEKELSSLTIVRLGFGRVHRNHNHSMQVLLSVGEGTLRIIPAVSVLEVLSDSKSTLQSCVLYIETGLSTGGTLEGTGSTLARSSSSPWAKWQLS